MIPYRLIRKSALGTASRVRSEHIAKVTYNARVPLNSLYSIGATYLYIDSGSHWFFVVWAWLVSLVFPPIFAFCALRSENIPRFIGLSYVAESAAVSMCFVASGYTPSVLACGAILTALTAQATAGMRIGILGFLAPFIGSALLEAAGMPRSAEYVSLSAQIVFGITATAYVFFVGAVFYKMLLTVNSLLREVKGLNQQIKEQVLVRYLPPDLINDIFDGKISMDTKPHSQQITVLFSDLSGFTKMSEQHGAEVVSEFLNDYLTIMNETIFANKGTIDKFIGDAIMVIFGAPVAMSEGDQAKNAARCAIAMQQGMVLVNQKWKSKGINEVSMRIGVHQGKAVVGNFGSAQRVDYTAIGPSVNLASRIETACTPGDIYVSQEVRELLQDEPATDLAGEFELKGIEGKTSLYKLVDWAN